MNHLSAKETLICMIELFKYYLEEIEESDQPDNQFVYGEKTAYVECLEIIQNWKKAKKHGLAFEIEERFPL